MAHRSTVETIAMAALMAVTTACHQDVACSGGVARVDGICPVSCTVLGSCGGADAADASDAVGDGEAGDAGDASDAGAMDADAGPAAPRLVSPISVATVTTQRPTLHWDLAAGSSGAHAMVCRDRALTQGCQSVDATGTSGRVATALSHGVWFWRAWGAQGSAVGANGSATWEFIVPARDSSVDSARGSAMDLNGDGYADLAVGAPFPMTGSGVVYFYAGDASSISVIPTGTQSGDAANDDYFGAAISPIGDINGDAIVDYLVGAPGAAAPSAWLFKSFASPHSVAGAALEQTTWGASIAGGGDIDGNGLADAVMTVSATGSPAGDAIAYFPSDHLETNAGPSMSIDAPDVSSQFGATLDESGDFDGDGFDDLVVGEPGYGSSAGRVYIFRGSASGPIVPASVSLNGLVGPGTNFGTALASGDLDGDGFDDLAVGELRETTLTGVVHVFAGGPSGLSATREVVIDSPDSGMTWFGAALGIEDVNGDGLADLVVGASYAGGNRGRIHVFNGQRSGIATVAAQNIDGPDGAAAPLFGFPLAVTSDVDGDGFGDIAVATGFHADGVHRVYVFRGGPTGLAATPFVRLNSPVPTDGDDFGHAMR